MRFNINLATQPYEDVQRFFVRWGLALFAVALLTAGLIYAAGTAYFSWRTVNKDTRYVRAQIAERDREKAAAEAVLNRPENRDTRDRSRFLNSIIARKAFSWTEVFEDMEKIMPPRLHVVSMKPKVDEQNQLELDLQVGGSSRESAIQLVRRLEESSHFAHPEVLKETELPAAQGSDPIHFEISAIYVPPFAQRRTTTAKTAEAAQPLVQPAKASRQKAAQQKEARNVGR